MLLTSIFPSVFESGGFAIGDSELDERMFKEQAWISFLVIFPLSIVIGHLSLRLATKKPSFLPVSTDVYNGIIRLVVVDIIWDLLSHAYRCVPFEEEEVWTELVLQSLGVGCPLYAKRLTLNSTGVVFAIRMLAVCFGVWIGEGFAPIALTGGIASGKTTVAQQFVEGPWEDLIQEEGGKEENDKEKEKNKIEKKDGDGKESEQTDKTPARKRLEIPDGTVVLVDADKIAHDLYDPTMSGNICQEILDEFGQDVALKDDSGKLVGIDRTKLGAKVFNDPSLRRRLNQMTHPRITSRLFRSMIWSLYFSGKHLCIVDVPLLFEAPVFLRSLFCCIICVSCGGPEQQLERLRSRNPELPAKQCCQRIAAQMPLEHKVTRSDLVIANVGDFATLAHQVEQARIECIYRIYGVGMTLFQLVTIMSVTIPVIVFGIFKWKQYKDGEDDNEL